MVAVIMAKTSPAKPLPFAQRLPEITILSDHATQGRDLEDEVAKLADQDLLALDSRLSSIFDILRHKNTQCPLAIAIYGDWGTGKTSAMRWLETQLNHWNSSKTERGEHPGTYPVWFDPWRYHTKEDVWRGIIAEVILALFRVSSLKPDNLVPKMVQAAKKFSGFLGRSFVHALANTQVEVEPEAAGTKLGKVSFDGDAFRSIWEEYDKAAHPHKAYLNQFEDTLRSWITDFIAEDQKLSKEHARIVLFIDDLDRCMPEVAMEVLEALKLYLNIPNLIFVVGLDRDVVNAVVCTHYERSNILPDKARHYLNKIFQVDLTIPPSEAQMGSFMKQQIQALNKATSGYWHKMLHASGHQETLENALTQLARHNPREVKRLLNSALIRGRTAATDPLLKEKLGTYEEKEALRFAQGVQVLLLQRHIMDCVQRDNLFIAKSNLAWLEHASSAVRLVFSAVRGDEIDIPRLLAAAQSVEDSKGVGKAIDEMEVKEAKIEPLFRLCKSIPFRDGASEPIDFNRLNNALFWQLLSVPFSQEVAQNAPPDDEWI